MQIHNYSAPFSAQKHNRFFTFCWFSLLFFQIYFVHELQITINSISLILWFQTFYSRAKSNKWSIDLRLISTINSYHKNEIRAWLSVWVTLSYGEENTYSWYSFYEIEIHVKFKIWTNFNLGWLYRIGEHLKMATKNRKIQINTRKIWTLFFKKIKLILLHL